MTDVNGAAMTQITVEQFYNDYQPLKNPFYDNASWDGCMLETYGVELEHVKTVFNYSPLQVWTVLDCDDKTIVVSGYHYVNRMGYIITANPAAEPYIEVQDSSEVVR